jgi:hypothetical protein
MPYWALAFPVAMIAVAGIVKRGSALRRVGRVVAGIVLCAALVMAVALVDLLFVSGWHQC